MLSSYEHNKRFIFNRKYLKSYFNIFIIIGTIFITLHLSSNYNRPSFVSERSLLSHRNENNLERIKEHLASIDVLSIDEDPVSPIDLIPKYDGLNREKYYKSGNWLNRIVHTFTNGSFKKFNELDLNTKCLLYFRNLYTMNPQWTNSFDSFSFYINDIDDKALKEMKDKYGSAYGDTELVKSHKKKNDIALAFERIRIYNKCFIEPENPMNINDIFNVTLTTKQNLVSPRHKLNEKRNKNENINPEDPYYAFTKSNQYDFENRMFPVVKDFDEDTFYDIWPKISDGEVENQYLEPGMLPITRSSGRKAPKFEKYHYDKSKAFWANWNAMSAKVGQKGIILSFSDGQLDTFLKLLVTLRYQKNKLPIQIIYKGDDLSYESKHKIYNVARSPNVDIPVLDHKTGKRLSLTDAEPQQVWFLDVTNTINPKHIGLFHRFKNKWLAVMFNLFEEYIFIDTDAISYIPLEDYFKTKEYEETGTLFFKDRVLKDRGRDKCVAILKTLHPKILETLNFGTFPVIDDNYVEDECYKYLTTEEKIYKRFFFDLNLHQMESGLLAVHKSNHIMAIVISSMLHLSRQVGSCSYGDKEFFWLGFLIAGIPYKFDQTNAGTMGELLVEKDEKNHIEKRVCSVQIAHFTPDHKLLWLNGGSHPCKFDSEAKKDWDNSKLKYLTGKFDTYEEFEEYYVKNPISSAYGVIAGDSIGSWNKQGDHCKGYSHCARFESKLKPFSFNERKLTGEVFALDLKEREKINGVNYVWAKYNYEEVPETTS